MKRVLSLSSVLCLLSFAVFAAGEDGLVAESERGRWSFSAGPSWRSRVKTSLRGTAHAAPLTTQAGYWSTTTGEAVDLDQSPAEIGITEHRLDPEAGKTVPAGQERWAATETFIRTDVTRTVEPGIASWTLAETDVDSPMGLDLQCGYEVWQGENLSVSLDLRFAGFWNMKSSAGGRVGGGFASETIATTTTKNWYLYCDDPYTGSPADDLHGFSRVSDASDPTYVDRSVSEPATTVIERSPARAVVTRFRGDLYQLGFGPRVDWKPFAGFCDGLDWLGVYGGVEALCNLAYSRFEADGFSSSSTDCLLGFGGYLGLVGEITDWLAIYGRVGYEWVDDADISAGGFTADVDYSSLVVSAGLQFSF